MVVASAYSFDLNELGEAAHGLSEVARCLQGIQDGIRAESAVSNVDPELWQALCAALTLVEGIVEDLNRWAPLVISKRDELGRWANDVVRAGILHDCPARVDLAVVLAALQCNPADLNAYALAIGGLDEGQFAIVPLCTGGGSPAYLVLTRGIANPMSPDRVLDHNALQWFDEPNISEDAVGGFQDKLLSPSWPSGYGAAVQRALQSMPGSSEGAKPQVVLMGHSQGGIVANQLAVDAAFTKHFDVTHVIALGSPVRDIPMAASTTYLTLIEPLDPVGQGDLLVDLVVAMNPVTGVGDAIGRESEAFFSGRDASQYVGTSTARGLDAHDLSAHLSDLQRLQSESGAWSDARSSIAAMSCSDAGPPQIFTAGD